MPTYSLTSPKTGRTYRVNFSQEPEESDMEEAVDAFDAEEPQEQAPNTNPAIDPTQGQLGTLGNSLARGFATIPSSIASAVVDTQRTVGDIAEKYTGPVGRQVAMSLTGGETLNTAARDFLDTYQGEVEAAYPINPENEVANVVGQALPQAAGMLLGGGAGAALSKTAQGAATAMRTVPLVMGGLLGTGQGIQQAEELGVEEPESRLAMGLLTGGIEAAIESIGGIGGKASEELISGARKKASELITDSLKSIAGEAFEEGVTTPAQNLVARAFANEDPNNPGFTKTGVALPNVDPTTKEFWKEIGLSMIGGAAGGTLFAGLNVASNLAQPDADPFNPEAPITEDDTSAEDLTLDEATALEPPAPVIPAPEEIEKRQEQERKAEATVAQQIASDATKVELANTESFETLKALNQVEVATDQEISVEESRAAEIEAANAIQAAQEQAATETQTQETKPDEESKLLQQVDETGILETQADVGQAPDVQGQEEVIPETQAADDLDPFESPQPEPLPANVPPAASPTDTTGTQDPFEDAPTQGEEVSTQREAVVPASGGTVADVAPDEVTSKTSLTESQVGDTGGGMDDKRIKRLDEDLQMSGVAYDGATRYAIKQASDETYYVERTQDGQRESISSGHPDIATARDAAISGIRNQGLESQAGMESNQPDADVGTQRGTSNEAAGKGDGANVQESNVPNKPVIRRTGAKVAGASVAGQQSAAMNAGRIATLRLLNQATNAYPNEEFNGIDPSQIDEVRDYMITIQRNQPTQETQQPTPEFQAADAEATTTTDTGGQVSQEVSKTSLTESQVGDTGGGMEPSNTDGIDRNELSESVLLDANARSRYDKPVTNGGDVLNVGDRVSMFTADGGRTIFGTVDSIESTNPTFANGQVSKTWNHDLKIKWDERSDVSQAPPIQYLNKEPKPQQPSSPPTQETWEQSPEFQAAEEAAASGDVAKADRIEAAWNEKNLAPVVTKSASSPKETKSGNTVKAETLKRGDEFQIGEDGYRVREIRRDGKITAEFISGPAFIQATSVKKPAGTPAPVTTIPRNRTVTLISKQQPPPTIPAKEQVDEGRGAIKQPASKQPQKRGRPTSAPVDVKESPKPDTKSSEQKKLEKALEKVDADILDAEADGDERGADGLRAAKLRIERQLEDITQSIPASTIKQGDTIRFKQDNKTFSGKYLGPITSGGFISYQIQVDGDPVIKRVSAKSINSSNDAQLEGTKLSRVNDTELRDAEYLEAVEAGDVAKQQRMVDQAAKDAGYNQKWWHGTNRQWTSYDIDAERVTDDGFLGAGIYLAKKPDFAEAYADEAVSTMGGVKRIIKLFVKADNTKVVRDEGTQLKSRSDVIGWTNKVKGEGYDSVSNRGNGDPEPFFGEELVVFSPSQIKSADPVTYDSSGQVIPLSQRFQSESPDIRYSRQRTTRPKTQGLERKVAERHLKKLGVPSSKVYLVDEPSFKWRGRYDPDAAIGLNLAYLNSIEELNDTLLRHEAIHDAVETDKKVKQRAIELLDALTDDELSIINEQIQGYSDAEIQDEQIVEAVRLMTSRRPDLRTKWARFVEAVSLAIKKFLGIKNLDRQVAELVAARILARGEARVLKGKMGGRDKFSGNMYSGDAVTAAKDAGVDVRKVGPDYELEYKGATLNLRIGSPERWEGVWPDDVFEEESTVAVVSAIRVPNESRGLGIGRTLMNVAESIASSNGASSVYLKSSPLMGGGDPTGFYQRLGYEQIVENEDGAPIMSKSTSPDIRYSRVNDSFPTQGPDKDLIRGYAEARASRAAKEVEFEDDIDRQQMFGQQIGPERIKQKMQEAEAAAQEVFNGSTVPLTNEGFNQWKRVMEQYSVNTAGSVNRVVELRNKSNSMAPTALQTELGIYAERVTAATGDPTIFRTFINEVNDLVAVVGGVSDSARALVARRWSPLTERWGAAAKTLAEVKKNGPPDVGEVNTTAKTQANKEAADKAPKDSTIKRLLAKAKGEVTWSEFFTENPRDKQKQRQIEMYEAIRASGKFDALSKEEKVELTKALDKIWRQEHGRVFLREFEKKIPLKNPRLKKQLAAQAPALLKAINLGTFDSQAYRKEIAQTYGLKDLSDADLVKVIKLGAEIQEARGESLAQRKKIEELANLVSGVTNIPKSHILASYYISSILASGRTGVGAMFSILEVAVEAVVGVTMTSWKSPTQAIAGLNAAFKAFPRGVLEGLSHFRTGDKTGTLLATDSFNQWLKGDGYSPISIGELLWRDKNPVKKFAGVVIMASERMLTGIDLTLSSTLHEASLVWGNTITEFKDSKGNTVSLRNPTATDKERMRRQVIAEWFGGVEPPKTLENLAKINAGMRDQIERFYIDEDPSAGLELVRTGRRVASGPSFQGEVTGTVGFLIKRINGLFADVGEAFDKYAKKNNISNIERNIAGLGVGLFALAKSFAGLQFVSFFGKLVNRNLQFVPGSAIFPKWIYGENISEYERRSIQTKNAIGLALITSVLAYIMGDDDDEEDTFGLEGSWESLSGEQRDAKRTAKALPSSIWFRDENGQKVYLSFANSSLSWVFTAAANLREIKVNNPEKWKETSDAAIAAEGIVGAAKSVFNTSAMGRLAELLGGSPFSKSTPGAGAEKLASNVATFAGGFVPSVIRELDFMLDPSYYEPKTLAERAVSVIPFLRRQVADSQGSLGVLGTPAQINRSPASRVYSSGADTEAEKILARMADEGLYLPLPDDKAGRDYVSPVSGRKIQMTPSQIQEYVKLVGESYQSFILREGENLMTMDRDKAKERISDAASKIKSRAARMSMRIQEPTP